MPVIPLVSVSKEYQPSDDVIAASIADVTTTSASYVLLKEFTLSVNIAGSSKLRFKFDVGPGGAAGTAYGKIYRNNAAIGTERSYSTTAGFLSTSEDINASNWVPGDKIQVWGKTDGGGCTCHIKNYYLCGLGSDWKRTV